MGKSKKRKTGGNGPSSSDSISQAADVNGLSHSGEDHTGLLDNSIEDTVDDGNMDEIKETAMEEEPLEVATLLENLVYVSNGKELLDMLTKLHEGNHEYGKSQCINRANDII